MEGFGVFCCFPFQGRICFWMQTAHMFRLPVGPDLSKGPYYLNTEMMMERRERLSRW